MSAKKSLFDNLSDNLSNSSDYLLDPGFSGDKNQKNTAKEDAIRSASSMPISSLISFKDHPYKVIEDSDDFAQLVESVRENGILYPILARPVDKDKYEIISGHRRLAAAKALDLKEVPVIIRSLNDDEATIAMVHSNFYREKILVSEKAKAYRMCLDAEKHQGKKGDDTISKVAEGQDSKTQIYRYVRLSYLNDEYLQMVDDDVLAFNSAYEISFLDESSLDALLKVIKDIDKIPSLDQAGKLRKMFSQKNESGESLTYEDISSVLSEKKEEKKPAVKVTLNEDKLYDYFDLETSVDEMQEIIFRLLDGYKNGTITLQQGSFSNAPAAPVKPKTSKK